MIVYNICDLVKIYPGQTMPANQDITLQIHQGEILGLLGDNGALIGTSTRNPQEASSVSLLTTLVLLGLGPVIVPPGRLPGIMLILGRLSPATYAASAFRQALLGPLSPRIWLDLAVLVGLSVAIFWLVGLEMDWRQQ